MKEQFIRRGDTHILYDGDAVPQFDPAWFDRAGLERSGAVVGETAQSGRVPAVFFTAGGDEFVLKHYRRGGWPGRFIRDAYCYGGEAGVRSFREWRMLAELQRLNFPAPVPCAARYRRRGACYTADLITFRIRGVQPLSQVLTQEALCTGRWRLLGEVIGRLHDAGICHADLNAHNVLLGGDMEEVYLVDFDRARAVGGLLADKRFAGNLQRLRRSLVKLQGQCPGFAVRPGNFLELFEGYRKARRT